MYDLSLINGEIYGEGQFHKKNLYITEGKIRSISEEVEPSRRTVDCRGLKILPGFIDPHVHFELDLGEFRSADDFYSGSVAAAFGGVTTVLDFLDPINSVDTYEAALASRLDQASKSCIDYGLHLTLGNFEEDRAIGWLMDRALKDGLSSVKVFTTYSESDRKCPDKVIEAVLQSKMMLLAHSENDELVNPEFLKVETFETSRPVIAEVSEVAKLAEMASFENGHLYIVHTSAGSTVEMVADRFDDKLGKNIFLESCPQYFYLTSEWFKGDEGRKFLLAPPLRSEEEQMKLRSQIHRISTIGTDHCPFMGDEKLKYDTANKVPKGIGSVEYAFLLMYNLFGYDIIEQFTSNPAQIFGLSEKGAIRFGKDADLVLFDPNKMTIVTSGHSACDYSPYEGMKLRGEIHSTLVRGQFVVEDRIFMGGQGKFIRRWCYESDY